MAEINFYWRYGLGLTIVGLFGMIVSVICILFDSNDPILFADSFLMASILLAVGASLLNKHSKLRIKVKD